LPFPPGKNGRELSLPKNAFLEIDSQLNKHNNIDYINIKIHD
jgi:hypothetical protein